MVSLFLDVFFHSISPLMKQNMCMALWQHGVVQQKRGTRLSRLRARIRRGRIVVAMPTPGKASFGQNRCVFLCGSQTFFQDKHNTNPYAPAALLEVPVEAVSNARKVSWGRDDLWLVCLQCYFSSTLCYKATVHTSQLQAAKFNRTFPQKVMPSKTGTEVETVLQCAVRETDIRTDIRLHCFQFRHLFQAMRCQVSD